MEYTVMPSQHCQKSWWVHSPVWEECSASTRCGILV